MIMVFIFLRIAVPLPGSDKWQNRSCGLPITPTTQELTSFVGVVSGKLFK